MNKSLAREEAGEVSLQFNQWEAWAPLYYFAKSYQELQCTSLHQTWFTIRVVNLWK